jgi:predicted phosphate transport protein (TIGR00153 family)
MKLFESRIGPSVFKSYYKHAEKVFETVERMNDCVKAACKGEDIKNLIKATSKSELKADKIKSKIREMLRGSVRLAIDKPVFLELVSRQDRIADYAENVVEILSFRDLYDNSEARKLVLNLADAVTATVEEYRKTVGRFEYLLESAFANKEKDIMHQHIGRVNDLEHEADQVEAKAAAYVFTNGDDQPLAAAHMYRLIQRLDDVANAAETAANSLLPIISK